MGLIFYFTTLLTLTVTTLSVASDSLYSPEVSPQKAWEYLRKSPYKKLPHTRVTLSSFISRVGENLLIKDSKRTVDSEDHFIPPQRKLLFPNGICLRGEWNISQHRLGYTGYFRPGSKAVIIGRAAVSLSNVNYSELRSLALSGKVFPTRDLSAKSPMSAANFLLMNDNAGKKYTYLTEAHLTNAAPRTISAGAIPLVGIALTVANAFDKADVRRDVRQLYQIAELEAQPPYSSPRWMTLKSPDQYELTSHKLKAEDFRHEVKQIIDRNKKLEFDIKVASRLRDGQPQYEKIGVVTFTEYVASSACDESLHFQHPPYRHEYSVPMVDQKF